MQPYQQRVIDEKAELDSKREKLTAFIRTEIFDSLDDSEKLRIDNQLKAMEEYSNILAERIQAFTP